MNVTTNQLQRGIRRVCFVVLLTAFALICSGAFAASSSGGSGRKTTITNVTSTVFDVDASGASLLFRSDDYNGSNQATYAAVTNVQSFIDSSGVWFLNLYPQKTGTRTVYITPDDAVGTQPAAPPPGYYWKSVEITSKCMDPNGNTVSFPNLVNGSSNCTFGIDFNYNGIVYKLLINRLLNPTDWTITAGSGAPPVVASFYSYTDTGPRSAPWVFIGQYYNSVRINVTNP